MYIHNNIYIYRERERYEYRIFLNGCFDLMHAGHFNALRQAKHLFYQRGFKKVVLTKENEYCCYCYDYYFQ